MLTTPAPISRADQVPVPRKAYVGSSVVILRMARSRNIDVTPTPGYDSMRNELVMLVSDCIRCSAC